MYFCKIENLAYGEINELSFNNPTPDFVLSFLQLKPRHIL